MNITAQSARRTTNRLEERAIELRVVQPGRKPEYLMLAMGAADFLRLEELGMAPADIMHNIILRINQGEGDDGR